MLTAEQIKLRNSGIGGSDAAAVAGASRYKTPIDVYLEKVGEQQQQADNPFTLRGSTLEPIVRKMYEIKTGQSVNVTNELFRHSDHDFIIGYIDGIVNKDTILECKTASIHMKKFWGLSGSDEIPTEYLFQCAHYAAIMNVQQVDIAVLFGGDDFFKTLMMAKDIDLKALIDDCDFRIYHYRKNEKLEKNLIETERAFWFNSVLCQVRPLPISGKDAAKIWADAQDKAIEADRKAVDIVDEIQDARERIKELEAKEEKLKGSLCAYMQDAAVLLGPLGERLATWKNQVTSRFDTISLRETNPQIYSQFLKVKESRVLRIS